MTEIDVAVHLVCPNEECPLRPPAGRLVVVQPLADSPIIHPVTDGGSAAVTRARRADGVIGTDIVGITEIADRAGTSPGTVRAWRTRHRDFPEPVAALSMGPVFDWKKVSVWLAKPRPTGRPRKVHA